MKSVKIKAVAVVMAVCASLMLTACNNSNTGSDNSSTVSSTASVSESSAENESSKTESEGESSKDETSSKAEVELVKDGVFTLPNGSLSFKLPDGWDLNKEVSILYMFEGKDNPNNFNLAVTTPDKNIQDVTSEEMTKDYEVTLGEFRLITFEHAVICGKPAVYMQLAGKISQADREMVLYQYLIQSGSKGYCFTFTNVNSDSSFVDSVIGSIIGTPDEGYNYSNGSINIK